MMKNQPNASTVLAEHGRQQKHSGDADKHKLLQQRLGTIVDVHPTLPMVTVSYQNGVLVAGGNFIGVTHSVLDIIQRFGRLRPGLRVMVTSINEMDSSATCEIVGVEDEKLGTELQQNNLSDTPLFEIFTPGS